MEKHKEKDAKFLIETFVILYDNWEKGKKPTTDKRLESVMKLLRAECENYGF